MVSAGMVEVNLVRHEDGTCYKEYTVPPGTPKYTGSPNERYVEVGTDERFEIRVKLLPRFQFFGHPKVRVEFYVDRGHYFRQTLSKGRPRDSLPSDMSHRQARLKRVRRFIGGEWMSCCLTFGSLESGLYLPRREQVTSTDHCADENLSLGNHQIAKEAYQTGRIVVKLIRGRFANRKAEESTRVRFFDPPEHVDLVASCKEVVHKHHVTHTLKYVSAEYFARVILTIRRHVPLRRSQSVYKRSCRYKRRWERGTGEGAEPMVFTLRYRSRGTDNLASFFPSQPC